MAGRAQRAAHIRDAQIGTVACVTRFLFTAMFHMARSAFNSHIDTRAIQSNFIGVQPAISVPVKIRDIVTPAVRQVENRKGIGPERITDPDRMVGHGSVIDKTEIPGTPFPVGFMAVTAAFALSMQLLPDTNMCTSGDGYVKQRERE